MHGDENKKSIIRIREREKEKNAIIDKNDGLHTYNKMLMEDNFFKWKIRPSIKAIALSFLLKSY